MRSAIVHPRQLLILLALCGLLAPAAQAQLAATPGLPRGDAAQLGFDPAKLKAIDALLAKAVEERRIAGGAALVARQGKVAHVATAGMQDAEAGTRIRQDTIYRIASMTKPITSVAAMMLVDEGKLRLDDPVHKYLPEFKNMRVLKKGAEEGQPLEAITTEATRPITIKHLLTHTSGLAYGLFDRPVLGKLYRQAGVADGLIETPGTMADNVRKLAQMPLLFQPGEGWEYGLNTDVLGAVVEVASGKTLDEFFRERIFQPLRMNDTHFVLPADKHARMAAVYAPDESKRIRRVGEEPQQAGTVRYSITYPLSEKSTYFSGGAGLVSTLGDYARFAQMLANHGELDGVRLLKPDTVAAMTQNQVGDLELWIPVHGDKFGLGFGVVTAEGRGEEPASVGAYSWGGIFYTYFLVDPKQELVLVVMTQIFPFDHLTLMDDVKRQTYQALQQ